MYHCKLIIAVFSVDPILTKIVHDTEPLEHFEHKIETIDRFLPARAAHADVILLETPVDRSLFEVRELCKPRAVLVSCLSPEAAAALSDEDIAAVDEVWECPLNRRLTALRFKRLLEQIKQKKDLWQADTFLDAAIDSIPDMVWFKAKDGAHVKVNKAFCHTVGKTREDVTGKDHCYIWDVSREEFERGDFVCKETEDLVMERRETCQFTEKVKSQHGMRQFRTYKSPLFDEDGNILGTVGIGHDETDLENMGTELEILLRSMPFAILVWDNNGIVVDINEKFESYFGVERAQLVGGKFTSWQHGDVEEIQGAEYREFRVVPNQDREERILRTHVESIYDVFHTEVGRLCIFRDVTVERALERQLLNNLNTDFLTGLHNRRYFYQYMNRERREQGVSLFYLDLDRFKEVNDTFGHKTGDQALIKTARLLESFFAGAFISRLGGDEFVVAILGNHSTEALREMAHNFQWQMAEAFENEPQFRILSACIGISRSDDPDLSIDSLLQQSDTALYAAKQRGRAWCCVYGD